MTGRSFLKVLLAAGLMMAVPAAAEFDPRHHGDLSGIIFLCATEPGSPRFDAAWLDWLTANPDADVDGAIATVISRSGTVRSMAIPGMAPAKPGSRPDPDAVAARMAALADRLRSR